MALSHWDASKVFTKNEAGSAVLILDRVAVEVPVDWVDMGLPAGGIMILGLTMGGM